MGRHLSFVREKGVEQAMYHFWQHGYYNSTITRLSRAMGITRSSFYNTFDSREALFDEVIDLYLQKSTYVSVQRQQPNGSIIKYLAEVVKDLCYSCSAVGVKGCLIINTIGELNGRQDPHFERLKNLINSAQQHYNHWLEQAIKEGEIKSRDSAEDLAAVLVQYLTGLSVMTKVSEQQDNLWLQAQLFLSRIELI